jgi:hypothetical protein
MASDAAWIHWLRREGSEARGAVVNADQARPEERFNWNPT